MKKIIRTAAAAAKPAVPVKRTPAELVMKGLTDLLNDETDEGQDAFNELLSELSIVMAPFMAEALEEYQEGEEEEGDENMEEDQGEEEEEPEEEYMEEEEEEEQEPPPARRPRR